MKIKNNINWIAAVLFPALGAHGADLESYCKNGLRDADGSLVCDFEYFFDDKGTLEKKTMGMVKSVTVSTQLKASLSKINDYIQATKIQIPETTVALSVRTSGDSLNLKITLAPYISLSDGNDIDTVQVSGGSLNVRQITGLTGFVCQTIQRILNENPDIRGKIISFGKEFLESARSGKLGEL